MTYGFDAPPVLRTARRSDVPQDKVLNAIATLIVVLLALALLWAPSPAAPPASALSTYD